MGFDSLIPWVLMAVSVFHYRKRELLDGFKQVLYRWCLIFALS